MNENQEQNQKPMLKDVLEIFNKAQATTWIAGYGGKLEEIIALTVGVGYQFSVVDSEESEDVVLEQKLNNAFNSLKDSKDQEKPKLLIYNVSDSKMRPMANVIAFRREVLAEEKISLLVLLKDQRSYGRLLRLYDLRDKFDSSFDLSESPRT